MVIWCVIKIIVGPDWITHGWRTANNNIRNKVMFIIIRMRFLSHSLWLEMSWWGGGSVEVLKVNWFSHGDRPTWAWPLRARCRMKTENQIKLCVLSHHKCVSNLNYLFCSTFTLIVIHTVCRDVRRPKFCFVNRKTIKKICHFVGWHNESDRKSINK